MKVDHRPEVRRAKLKIADATVALFDAFSIVRKAIGDLDEIRRCISCGRRGQLYDGGDARRVCERCARSEGTL